MASLLAFDRLGITCKEALLFDGGNPVGAAANKPYAHEVREARAGALAFASSPLHVMVAGKSLEMCIRDRYKSISNLVTPKKKQVKGRK